MSQMVVLAAGLVFVAFIVFCLRQGSKVGPREGLAESSNLAAGIEHDHSGSDDGCGSGH